MDGAGKELRVGDPERDQAIAWLGEHLGAGRLEIDEFDQRCARVAAARYWSEITPLFEDLPAPRPEPAGGRGRTGDQAPATRHGSSGGAVLGIAAVVAVVALFVVTKQFLLLLLAAGALGYWVYRRRS